MLSHSQSFIERGFSVNKELMDTNMKEESLVSQRLTYDKIMSEDWKISAFQISPKLRRSCMLASQRYKQDLEKKKRANCYYSKFETKIKVWWIRKLEKEKERFGNNYE